MLSPARFFLSGADTAAESVIIGNSRFQFLEFLDVEEAAFLRGERGEDISA